MAKTVAAAAFDRIRRLAVDLSQGPVVSYTGGARAVSIASPGTVWRDGNLPDSSR